MERRILIAGSGGQGVLFLGKLLAEAGLHEGKQVTWFPSYGAEMRGGTANCTVIISDTMIGSPVTRTADILIALNTASLQRFQERLVPGGMVLYDASLIPQTPGQTEACILPIPASSIAASLNNSKAANMALAGAFAAVTDLLSLESLFSALEHIVSVARRDGIAVNAEIIRMGYKRGQDTKSCHR
jgi:2-oxoglutarate ferredoxin oxidoreductase subunit gamma